MRIAESAAGWLRRRDPKAWLSLAIVVLIDDGQSHHVVPRVEAVNMLEKARAKASQNKFVELERDLAVGIDLVKAAAPIEVPVVAFFEREDRPIETGVITLRLPTKAAKRPRGEA